MYIPNCFKNNDVSQLQNFISHFNFATLITSDTTPFISHIPLLLDANEGKLGVLMGHMAKSNPHWQVFKNHAKIKCIFQGPHAYISPRWYQDLPSVPTWNYTAVHAQGTVKLCSTEQLIADLEKLIAYFDPTLVEFQNRAMWEADKEVLLNHIVGFRIEIESLEGIFKLSQNHSEADRQGVIKGLINSDSLEDKALGYFMERYFQK